MIANDAIGKQIEELIIQANDPKDKALLLVLNKIANSLDENTALTRTLTGDLKAHTQAFEAHEKAEMALINQGRGFLRAAIAGLAILQGFTVWYFQRHLESEERVSEKVAHLEIFSETHKTHHEMEERSKAK